nr:cytosine permease [Escherichia coli]
MALTFVMLGLTFFSASMWTGGTLGTGLSYHDFFLAVLIGNLLLGIYTSFLGYIGAKTGLTTHLLARFSFGVKGSWLPSLLLGGTQVGWFGVGVAMFSIPVGKATGLDINLLIAVSGLLMTVTVFFGISALTVLSVINGIIGTVCALWLYNNFVGWLTFLSAAIPPVGGVIIADYLMNRRRYEHFATTRMMSVNWVAILAVALGIAAGHWLPGIVPVNAVLGGALSYLILNPILNRKTTAAMTHVEANSVE